ncbi:MAG: CCA tRNA nucleotidyltransferase, partial [Paracoccaceae bacterium]|nr:CCA tRNA nucleotidyltransferase [Paracoccaceae bacterium]
APNPAPSLAVMQQIGVLTTIIEGADAKALSILVHNEESITKEPKFSRRLAALGGENVGDALRLSRADIRDTAIIKQGAIKIESAKETGYRLGALLGLDARLLRSAMLETEFDTTEVATIQTAATQVFPVKAVDLMPAFQGAALGSELRRLESLWIASEFSLSKAVLLES